MLDRRVISSVVGLLLLTLIVLGGSLIFSIGIFFVAFIALTEFYSCVARQSKPIKIIGYACALFIIVIGYNIDISQMSILDFSRMIDVYLLVFLVFLAAAFSVPVFTKMAYKYVDVAVTLMSVLYIIVPFSFIAAAYNLQDGKLLVLLIFAGGWSSDTFGFFIGSFFGKTKILPEISPKKTLEGAVGGFLGSVVIITIIGFIFHNAQIGINIYHYTIMGMLSGVLSQIGDWTASVIKRQCRVKDFGKIMPGHGGVLDRFDSILFVAPTIYFYLKLVIKI